MTRSSFFAVVVILAAACGDDPPKPKTSSIPRPVSAAPAVVSTTTPVTQPAARPCPAKPNILVISLDTLRFDATSLDPKSSNETPFLRSLAEIGTSFTRCYSTWDATPPSHFSMLTGFISGLGTEIDVGESSIAHQLKKRGYRTWGVVANGNLSPRAARYLTSFDRYSNLWDVWKELDADRKAAIDASIDAHLRTYGHAENDVNRMMVFASADRVLRQVAPRLRERQPFFGFINFLDAHDPYLPDTSRYAMNRERTSVPDLRNRELSPEVMNPTSIETEDRRAVVKAALVRTGPIVWKTAFDLNAAERATYRRRYHAKVRDVDAAVREVFALLRKEGLLDSTIVIITSDHGEAFGESDVITHSFNNNADREATNHVPLIAVFPPCYGFKGASVRELVTIADIAPTIYDLLEIDPWPVWKRSAPGNFGRSLLPLIRTMPAPVAQSPADGSAQSVTDAQRKQDRDEATARLRSLGYLR